MQTTKVLTIVSVAISAAILGLMVYTTVQNRKEEIDEAPEKEGE